MGYKMRLKERVSQEKNEYKFLFLLSLVIALAVLLLYILPDNSPGSAAGNDEGSEYILLHKWTEQLTSRGSVHGRYTLKVNLVDKSGKPVEGAEVTVWHDPGRSGRILGVGNGIMKQNKKGDYFLPIYFTMGGGWKIVISARKEGIEIAKKTILLNITTGREYYEAKQ